MSRVCRAVIVVRTANRPAILERCIAAAVENCSVAQDAFWLLLDDSSADHLASNREVARSWRKSGLRLTHVDRSGEREIAGALPNAECRSAFTALVARSPSCPAINGRNLGLLCGLSLEPDVLCLIDDDMVTRHEETCFLHWCVSGGLNDKSIGAPRDGGIGDIPYLRRLTGILKGARADQFLSEGGFSADSGLWYSPSNPLWKRGSRAPGVATTSDREVLKGGLLALQSRGAEWIPFPREYNEDLNWSLLQSAFHGTPLLKVSGMNVQHLPPRIAYAGAETIISELVGTGITRALRRIKPRGEACLSVLAEHLPDVFRTELKAELVAFIEAERTVRTCVQNCPTNGVAHGILAKMETTLAEVAERLKSIDFRRLADEWLRDFADRHRMFLVVRRSDAAQSQIRRVLLASTS